MHHYSRALPLLVSSWLALHGAAVAAISTFRGVDKSDRQRITICEPKDGLVSLSERKNPPRYISGFGIDFAMLQSNWSKWST